ncbi:MAG: phosphoribosylglycinamide formyltransferase [Phototrophicales bacterium]|nr:MAG: phosphoribosylglycinamide formyltransferase [Phototrophicales bacterium]
MGIVVLISGNGSNLQALIDAVQSKKLPTTIDLVVSNRKSAYGLQRAEAAGIPTLVLTLKSFLADGKTREDYDRALAEAIWPYKPQLIVLAGWMHILSSVFLEYFPNRVINLHPALPNEFAGINAIERAFEAYQRGEIKQSGCMVHYAIPEVDAGDVIVQEIVPFLPNDTLESFAERMHAAEHRILVEAVSRLLAQSSS